MPSSPAQSETSSAAALQRPAGLMTKLSLVLLGLLIAGWSAHMWPQWLHNPDLSHGLFTPLLFILLLKESRASGTRRFLPANGVTFSVFALLAFGGLTLLGIGGLYAAAVGWSHALSGFFLATSLCVLLSAAWVAGATDTQRLVPINWPAAISIAIWFFSAPLPPGSYSRLTGQLQLWVTDVVLFLLHALGIVAVKNGNIIELSNVSVGVEEACSGVRSLISCVFAGLFFSAALVRRPGARVAIIALAAPLAIAMNIVRSFTLTLLAKNGVDIRGSWHDLTGFGVLAVTAALLAGLAISLEKSNRKPAGKTEKPGVSPLTPPSGKKLSFGFNLILLGTQMLAVALAVFFLINTKPARLARSTPPNLEEILPSSFTTWQVVTSNDLFRFSDQLHTERLVERTYGRGSRENETQITVYIAYWPAGQAPVSLVASHTPDACWPGTGWESDPANQKTDAPEILGRSLPNAECRLFSQGHYRQNVWYWHLFDGQPIEQRSVRSPRQLLWLAWHYGFRNEGEQFFVRVSSNQPWNKISQEPLVQEIFKRLQPYGL